MYRDISIWILEELGLNYIEVEREHGTDYIHCQNPIIDGDNQASFQIYVEDGWAKSWNGMINGKDRVHLMEKVLNYVLVNNQ